MTKLEKVLEILARLAATMEEEAESDDTLASETDSAGVDGSKKHTTNKPESTTKVK